VDRPIADPHQTTVAETRVCLEKKSADDELETSKLRRDLKPKGLARGIHTNPTRQRGPYFSKAKSFAPPSQRRIMLAETVAKKTLSAPFKA